ncbi:nitroreductase family protein [Marinobacter salicampi]|uniref:nitroreductase family protein n=1 Tax=Marinobacter salicampi TaxID=435907 RepID=UPI00140D6F3E|nr:nitroreductase family protein [Marinobacter salicampi]
MLKNESSTARDRALDDPRPALPPIDVEEFRKVVRSRRSIRRFTDEEVPGRILDDCLELAMLAPNSSNLQPWEFYVVSTPAIKQRLAEACLGQNAARTAPVLIGIVARTNTWRANSQRNLDEWPEEKRPGIVEKYYSRIAPLHYNQGPLGLFGLAKKAAGLAVGLRRPVPRGPYSPCEMKVWAAKSTALAAENLMLAARAHGFDSCPMEGFDDHRVRKILGVPRDGIVIMVLALGRRAENGVYNRQYRFAPEDFIRRL